MVWLASELDSRNFIKTLKVSFHLEKAFGERLVGILSMWHLSALTQSEVERAVEAFDRLRNLRRETRDPNWTEKKSDTKRNQNHRNSILLFYLRCLKEEIIRRKLRN